MERERSADYMKKRFEAEEKDTWKLEDMIESNEAWEALFEEASGETG